MEHQEITIRFADLRRAAETVPAYVRETLGVDEQVTLYTAIEDDLGIVGLDMQELLFDFSKKYQIDLLQFDFTGCISPEPTGDMLLPVLLLPLFAMLFLLAWAANVIAALCCAPFSLSRAPLMLRAGIGDPFTIARELLFPNMRPRPAAQILTVGDFVASAATGYFVKRERVRFALAK